MAMLVITKGHITPCAAMVSPQAPQRCEEPRVPRVKGQSSTAIALRLERAKSREWIGGNGMITTSDYGSFPHSLRLAPVSFAMLTTNRPH